MIPPEDVGEGNRVISIELGRDTAVEVGSESEEQLNNPKKSFNWEESHISLPPYSLVASNSEGLQCFRFRFGSDNSVALIGNLKGH